MYLERSSEQKAMLLTRLPTYGQIEHEVSITR